MIFFMINPFFLFYFTLALEQPGERVCFAIKHVVFGSLHLDIFPARKLIWLNRNGKQNHIDPHVFSPPVVAFTHHPYTSNKCLTERQ